MALLTKVKTRMAIHAHRKVRGLLDGEYQSFHSGRSMDFQDLREYVAGDDVKDLDWKASARKGELLVKRYHAERKHTILLVVGRGRSMAGLCPDRTPKNEIAIFAAGVMGYLATKHSDYVGMVYGDAEEVHSVRPATTELALERMLGHLVEPTSAAGDLTGCLDYVTRAIRRRTIMVVITDDVDLSEEDERLLRLLRVQHEILFLTLADLDPTDPGLESTPVIDADTWDAIPAFLRNDAQLHAEIAAADAERHARRRRTLERLGIAGEHITGEDQVIMTLFRLLERHRHGND
ncbi:MAG: DUF58 domain-containing protein [Propionibacterium sp.]|nr:DUF58 domain-containing protein [Propionibacterium sp.]